MSAPDGAGVGRPPYYPVYLDLRDRPCLVVGGGPIAVGKVRGFLEAGARVTVVAPEAGTAIHAWQAEGVIAWRRRDFAAADVAGAFLVVAATDDRELNAAIYRLADRAGAVANAVDDLDHCNFIAPAVARAGSVQIAVSTAGQSPALAKRLRDQVAHDVLVPSVAPLSAFLGAWRPRVKQAIDGYGRRQVFWEGVLDGCIPRLLAAGERAKADAAMTECLRRRATPGTVSAGCAADPAKPAGCRACGGAAAAPSSVGTVYLVGAGPGAPDLITQRGVAALRRADVVFFDRLAHPSLLDHAPPHAARIYAGREAGEPGGDRQAGIHEQLLAHARAGRTVVRLKGGDPFVFGRGGEEMLALAAAGVPCEVVPGVSAALAVPASAGVPVTHRGVATAFGVFTGHDAADPNGSSTDWALAARMPTAVFMMGALHLSAIIDRLVAHGRGLDTPAIAIERGTLPEQRVHGGTLRELRCVAAEVAPPAVLVVGEVAALRRAGAGERAVAGVLDSVLERVG